MRLTHRNYFSKENNYLSNSKLGDYLKDKRYFYEKHIAHTREKRETPALKIGSAVDLYVTKSRAAFNKAYRPVKRRNLKEPPTEYTELTEAEYDTVVGISERVRKQQIAKELKGFTSQRILKYEMALGHFRGVCGIPDWYKVEGDKGIIVDLKTTAKLDGYEWSALKYGYYRQQAFYQMLLQELEGCETFESYHLVVEKDVDSVYNCKVFRLSQRRIDEEKKVVAKLLREIKDEKAYKANNVGFEDAVMIGEFVAEVVGNITKWED